MSDKQKNIYSFINSHIKDLASWDIGACHLWKDNRKKLVDIEWADGVSAFDLNKVLNLIKEKGDVTKSELVDKCLH